MECRTFVPSVHETLLARQQLLFGDSYLLRRERQLSSAAADDGHLARGRGHPAARGQPGSPPAVSPVGDDQQTGAAGDQHEVGIDASWVALLPARLPTFSFLAHTTPSSPRQVCARERERETGGYRYQPRSPAEVAWMTTATPGSLTSTASGGGGISVARSESAPEATNDESVVGSAVRRRAAAVRGQSAAADPPADAWSDLSSFGGAFSDAAAHDDPDESSATYGDDPVGSAVRRRAAAEAEAAEADVAAPDSSPASPTQPWHDEHERPYPYALPDPNLPRPRPEAQAEPPIGEAARRFQRESRFGAHGVEGHRRDASEWPRLRSGSSRATEPGGAVHPIWSSRVWEQRPYAASRAGAPGRFAVAELGGTHRWSARWDDARRFDGSVGARPRLDPEGTPLDSDSALVMVMEDLKQLDASKAEFDAVMGDFWRTMGAPT